jgi:hypothetical protein
MLCRQLFSLLQEYRPRCSAAIDPLQREYRHQKCHQEVLLLVCQPHPDQSQEQVLERWVQLSHHQSLAASQMFQQFADPLYHHRPVQLCHLQSRLDHPRQFVEQRQHQRLLGQKPLPVEEFLRLVASLNQFVMDLWVLGKHLLQAE